MSGSRFFKDLTTTVGWVEHLFLVQEVVGSNPGWTNTSGS
jgi:hypothetical protein